MLNRPLLTERAMAGSSFWNLTGNRVITPIGFQVPHQPQRMLMIAMRQVITAGGGSARGINGKQTENSDQ